MKKSIKLLILIILSSSVYFIYNLKKEVKINYVSIGDGFATGINSYHNISYGYNDYLKDYFKKKDILGKYDNFSYEDMMTKDIKKDILININDKDKNNIRRTLREANLLTISVGINDLIYEIDVNNPQTNSTKEKILTKIVDKLDEDIKEIKKYYHGPIYLVGYYNFYPQNSVERNMLNELNKKYQQFCGNNNIIFIDNHNLDTKLYNYLENPNSFYPNVNGYEIIYKNILDSINNNGSVE